MTESAKAAFQNYLREWWHASLPESAFETGKPGSLNAMNWHILYCFGQVDGREYMDVYGSHRMTNDHHLRVFADGEVESLEAYRPSYGWDPKIPGDEERAKSEFAEHSRRITRILDEKWPDQGR